MMGTNWDDFWDHDHDCYNLAAMTDLQVMGLADGYDDNRIDAVIDGYLTLRKEMRNQIERLKDALRAGG